MSLGRVLRLACAAVLVAAPLRAQSAQCTGNIAPNKQSTTALAETATDNDLATGYHVFTQSITLTITANAVVLCASVQTPPLDMGTVGGYSKPYSDLQIQVAPGGWAPLTPTETVLYSGAGKNPMVLSVNVRVAISEVDAPGQYGATVVLTPYKK